MPDSRKNFPIPAQESLLFQLTDRIIHFKIDFNFKLGFEEFFNPLIQSFHRKIFSRFHQNKVISQDQLLTVFFLRIIEQVLENAGIIIQILKIEVHGQVL